MDYNPYKHSRRPLRNRTRSIEELDKIVAPVLEELARIFPSVMKKEQKK